MHQSYAKHSFSKLQKCNNQLITSQVYYIAIVIVLRLGLAYFINGEKQQKVKKQLTQFL